MRVPCANKNITTGHRASVDERLGERHDRYHRFRTCVRNRCRLRQHRPSSAQALSAASSTAASSGTRTTPPEALSEAIRVIVDGITVDGTQMADECESLMWGFVNMLHSAGAEVSTAPSTASCPRCATSSARRTAPR